MEDTVGSAAIGAAIYAYIEDWWGEEFSPHLIDRISTAPIEHLTSFERSWPKVDAGLTENVPVLEPGKIRPVYGPRQQFGHIPPYEVEDAIRGLLLMESVVLDFLWISPFRWFHHGYLSEITNRNDFPDEWPEDLRRLLPERLRDMLRLRPLISDGSIVLSQMRLDSSDRSNFYRILEASENIEQELRTIRNFWSEQPESHNHDDQTYAARQLAIPVSLACEGRGTLLSISPFYDTILREITRRRLADGRISQLEKLLHLSSPRLDGDVKQLAKIRQSSDEFARFRSALSTALDTLLEVPVTESGRSEAAAVIDDVLRGQLHDVERAVKKSSALSALRDGTTRLTISGIGLAAGTLAAGATGSLESGSVAALAAAGAASIQKYIQAAADRRRDAQLWDFVVSLTWD